MSDGFDLTYLSLGAGVQSTALYILAARGERGVPRADVAVFADTGDEPDYVYEQIASLRHWGKKNGGAEIVQVDVGISLSEAMMVRWIPIPAFTVTYRRITGDDGEELLAGTDRESMIRRDCTKEFKVVPIQRYIKEARLGRPRGYPVKQHVRNMVGFSCEEATRIKPSREKWITTVYPLIDAWLYRPHCIRIVEGVGLPTPRKSACIFCPFHSDRYWAEMKRDRPADFEKACDVDDKIRSKAQRDAQYEYVNDGKTQSSRHKALPSSARVRTLPSTDGLAADEIFIHRSCKPLRLVEFGDQPALWDEECEGNCGV